jgi:hypothetical protein
MKKLVLLCLCCITLMQAKANMIDPSEGGSDTLMIKIPYTKSTRANSVGLSVGTQGIGLEGQFPLLKQWQVRVGGTILPVSVSRDYVALPSRTAVVSLDANFSKLHLIADWEPLAETNSFLNKLAISGGAAYYIYAKGTANLILKDPYQYGDIQMSPEEVGELVVDSDWKGFAPYLGVGLNRMKIANNISLDVTLGASRMPSPVVEITGTKMLADNDQNSAQLQKNLSNYRLLPTLQFSLNYTFKSE